jgi:5'-nucleotidase
MRLPVPIVLTNDDGIGAKGLDALAAALEPLVGEGLHVVAPARCHSGCSQQVTMDAPLAVSSTGPNRYAVSGSPADCVRLALTKLVPSCGLVLSGINHGGNMGHDILLSGTVGAARESAMLGVPAIAISQYFQGKPTTDWEQSAANAIRALAAIDGLAPGEASLWNVNLPHASSSGRDADVVFCRPCVAPLPISFQEREEGYSYDGSRYHERQTRPGTDVTACFGGDIAVSRLQVGPVEFQKSSP